MAVSERLMVDKHPEIDPGCLNRMQAAAASRTLPFERVVELVPGRLKRLHQAVRDRANRRYHRRLAPTYLAGWERGAELCELRRHLGARFDSARLVYGSVQPDLGPRVHPGSDRTDEDRLFDLARRALDGRTHQALSLLRHHLPPGSRILDYGCGIGSDGLGLAQAGYAVQFADRAGAPLTYLKWRLAERGLLNPVYELGRDDLPGDLDAVLCLDAATPGCDPYELLSRLEQAAPIVALGFFPETAGHGSPSPDSLAAGTERSRPVARHELPGGSLLLVFRRHEADPMGRDEPAVHTGRAG